MNSVMGLKSGRLLGLAVVAVALCATGCAKTGKVTGVVKFEDKVVPGGHISYIPSSGGKAEQAEIGSDGSYSIEAPIGACKITVDTAYLMTGGQQGGPMGGPMPGGAGAPKMPEGIQGKADAESKDKLDKAGELYKAGQKEYMEIPSKYADPDKSGLTFTVAKGSQENSINLERPKDWKSQKEHGKSGPPKPGEGAGPGPR